MNLSSFTASFDVMLIISPIITIIIGVIIYNVLKKVIKRLIENSKEKDFKNKQRLETLVTLVLNIIKYLLFALVIIIILATWGVNVTSLITGLGITTAIVGLALQDLAKDIIAGLSIITEGQYEVGDIIGHEGFIGEVVFLGLKTTRIRNYKGEEKIIANRYMDKLVNYSINNSLAIVDIGIAYEENSNKVEKALNRMAEKLNGKIENTKGDIQVLGITALADSSIVYRVTVETAPMQHYAVERELRKEIKKTFDESNIKIPYKQIEVHNGK